MFAFSVYSGHGRFDILFCLVCLVFFVFFSSYIKRMDSYHAALWSPHYDVRDRITHQQRTKQRGKRQQRSQDSWTWEEILDCGGPWAQPEEYRRPKAELEVAKAERRRYEEAARLEAREAAQNIYLGGTWSSRRI